MADDAPVGFIITLTTDFGLTEHYVGAMKGAILSVNPRAIIVDVTHEVRPQRIDEGSYLLGGAWPYFPSGSVHVTVVDPGVGGERRALAMKTPAGYFVGPDNGVLSSALPDAIRPRSVKPVQIPEDYVAVAITNPAYMRHPVSSTFHGRDVFAPVAAHLTLGVDVDNLGERIDSMVALPLLKAVKKADGGLAGRVIHVDRFGNLVTSIRAVDLGGHNMMVEIAGEMVHGLASTYGDGEDLIALIDSSGYLEVAMPRGDAAALLGAGLDTPVSVKPVVVKMKRPL